MKHLSFTLIIVACSAAIATVAAASEQNWNQFCGPNGDGISNETRVNFSKNSAKHVLHVANLPLSLLPS